VKLAEVHPTLREALATFEAFRRLGVAAANLWVLVDREAGTLGVQLTTPAGTFVVGVGNYPAPAEEVRFGLEWGGAIEAFLGDTQEARDELWAGSWISDHLEGLVAAMVDKGFEIPLVHGAAEAG
jgi:hypothetical protein